MGVKRTSFHSLPIEVVCSHLESGNCTTDFDYHISQDQHGDPNHLNTGSFVEDVVTRADRGVCTTQRKRPYVLAATILLSSTLKQRPLDQYHLYLTSQIRPVCSAIMQRSREGTPSDAIADTHGQPCANGASGAAEAHPRHLPPCPSTL